MNINFLQLLVEYWKIFVPPPTHSSTPLPTSEIHLITNTQGHSASCQYKTRGWGESECYKVEEEAITCLKKRSVSRQLRNSRKYNQFSYDKSHQLHRQVSPGKVKASNTIIVAGKTSASIRIAINGLGRVLDLLASANYKLFPYSPAGYQFT